MCLWKNVQNFKQDYYNSSNCNRIYQSFNEILPVPYNSSNIKVNKKMQYFMYINQQDAQNSCD